MPALLWGTRIVLLVSVLAHFLSAFALWKQNQAARPRAYRRQVTQVTTYAARTMRWGGVIVLLFIIYHLMHLTIGTTLTPEITEEKVYRNVVTSF
jgi:succinate dehydrogenase / fumarate reductase cytochrome b subunit